MIVYCAYCGPLSGALLEKYPSGDDAWRIHLRSEEHQKALNEWAADHSDGKTCPECGLMWPCHAFECPARIDGSGGG